MFALPMSPPYYAVIFTAEPSSSLSGYAEMAAEMRQAAAEMPGFLGIESAAEESHITVSYWRNLENIKQWKAHLRHRQAQKLGREKWYNSYRIRIAKVERDYESDKFGNAAN